MKVMLIQVGKTVNRHFVELIDEYADRLKHYVGFDMSSGEQSSEFLALLDGTAEMVQD